MTDTLQFLCLFLRCLASVSLDTSKQNLVLLQFISRGLMLFFFLITFLHEKESSVVRRIYSLVTPGSESVEKGARIDKAQLSN